MQPTPQAEAEEADCSKAEGSMPAPPGEALEEDPVSFSRHLAASPLGAGEEGWGCWTGVLGVQQGLLLELGVERIVVRLAAEGFGELGRVETNRVAVTRRAGYTSLA